MVEKNKLSSEEGFRCNMKKRLIILIVLILLVIGAVVVGIRCKSQKLQEEGVYVADSAEVSYEYTKYKDYIVLEKYTGGESEVILPEIVENLPVTHIGRECFLQQEQLEKVILHDSIQYIGVNAFNSCKNLQEITGGKNIICVDGGAFGRCVSLEIVEIGDKLERIDDVAFSGCSSLKQIPYQPNLMYIGANAFFETALEEIPCGNEVSVQEYAFSDTPWLERQEEDFIIFDGGLVYYLGEDETVVVPDDVEALLYGVFGEDTNVQTVYLPESVTSIRARAFRKADDYRVYIPSSVTTFGDEAGGNKIYWEKDLFTIVTTEGSCAQQYAKEHGLKCEIVDEIVYPQ